MNMKALGLFVLSMLSFTSLMAETSVNYLHEVPQGVRVLKDCAYVENGLQAQKLDLYLPDNNIEKGFPIIVLVHGGGWSGGDKSKWFMPVHHFLTNGYAVASVNYRLSSEAPFPAQIEDVKAAVRWLRANSMAYAIDPTAIGAWGASAGGQLVSLLATSGKSNAYQVGAYLNISSEVQAVCDSYGPVDLLSRMGKLDTNQATTASTLQYLGGTNQALFSKAKDASPLFQVTATLPPFLILHGDTDTTVPLSQSEEFFKVLLKEKVPVNFHVFLGAGHGGFTAPIVIEKTLDFFNTLLKQKQVPASSKSESLNAP